jgi:L-fuconolactonase
MTRVDTHTHVLTSWFEPVETLLYHLDANHVDCAVLIQDTPQANNDYLFDCVRRYPGRFAPVVIVDADSPDAVAQLEREANRGASGVRLRMTTRSPGEDPLAIWRAASRLSLPISCSGRLHLYTDKQFLTVLEALGETPLVIEHLGSGQLPDSAAVSVDQRQHAYAALARYPNVAIKFHGLGEFSRRALPPTEAFPFEQPISPALQLAFAAFGASRMMWGSDFPLVCAREGYRNALQLAQQQFAQASPSDQEQLFGGAAIKIFSAR